LIDRRPFLTFAGAAGALRIAAPQAFRHRERARTSSRSYPSSPVPDQFRQLADALTKRGHSAARIEKILGHNFVRYARAVWDA